MGRNRHKQPRPPARVRPPGRGRDDPRLARAGPGQAGTPSPLPRRPDHADPGAEVGHRPAPAGAMTCLGVARNVIPEPGGSLPSQPGARATDGMRSRPSLALRAGNRPHPHRVRAGLPYRFDYRRLIGCILRPFDRGRRCGPGRTESVELGLPNDVFERARPPRPPFVRVQIIGQIGRESDRFAIWSVLDRHEVPRYVWWLPRPASIRTHIPVLDSDIKFRHIIYAVPACRC